MTRRTWLVTVVASVGVLGAGAALAVGLASVGTSTAANPVAPHHVPVSRTTAGATSTTSPPPSTSQPATQPASPVAAPAHPSTHGTATTKSHTSGESDADRANRAPINGRPSGQSDPPGDIETPETGTKNGNAGPGDGPITTPTALPNPGATAPPYQP
ncbi:MAG TPA: hypothetical protein VGN81_01820 [Pseudonocardiaceae bacterium]|jgi:hypothetical protein